LATDCNLDTVEITLQRIILAFFILILLAVHGIAPGSSRYCLMSSSPSCQNKVQINPEMSVPDCCSDECMTGESIVLPITELSASVGNSVEHQTNILLTNNSVFRQRVPSIVRVGSFSARRNGGPPIARVTQLAKLQIFLI
jgi:hypothetical protein